MIILLTSMLWAEPLQYYLQGHSLAAQGQHDQAIESYLSALDEQGPDPHIYWGLGNSLQASGDALLAQLAWARAKKLQPWNTALSGSLSEAQGSVKVPTIPAELLSWLASLAFGLGIWRHRRKKEAIALFVVCAFLAWFSWRAMENDRLAYIISAEVSVRSTPSASGISLFLLQKGDDFRIIKRRSNNYFIEKENKRGWIVGDSFLSLDPHEPFFMPKE